MGVATSTLIAAGVAAAGTGAAVYGANQNRKAQKQANAANIAAQQESDRLNYLRWLETQGMGPNGQAVNTRLPRWMGVNVGMGGGGGVRRVVRRTGAPGPQRMTSAAQAPMVTNLG